MPDKKQNRNRHGGVSVSARSGVLRLRWTYAGQRKQMSLRIPDSPENRLIAQQKAAQIEADIIGRKYDETLDSYRVIASALPAQSATKLRRLAHRPKASTHQRFRPDPTLERGQSQKGTGSNAFHS